jgi:hypothetical protein
MGQMVDIYDDRPDMAGKPSEWGNVSANLLRLRPRPSLS